MTGKYKEENATEVPTSKGGGVYVESKKQSLYMEIVVRDGISLQIEKIAAATFFGLHISDHFWASHLQHMETS